LHPEDANSMSRELGTSAVRHRHIQVTHHTEPPVYPRASRPAPAIWQAPTAQLPVPDEMEDLRQRPRKRWGMRICLTLFLFFLGWFLLNQLLNQFNLLQDQVHFGYPRTFQTDKDVGHSGTSHFIVENLQGHIDVIEIPSDNPSKAKL